MRRILYSANFGKHDRPKPLPLSVREPGVEYIMLSDSDRPVDGWQVHKVPCEKNSRMTARKWKTRGFQELGLSKGDWAVWVDASMIPKVPLSKLVDDKWLKKFDVAVYAHPQRKCVYAEIEACRKLRKDTSENLDRVLKFYQQKKWPKNSGLAATPIVARRVTEMTTAHSEDWWLHIQTLSIRDQLSFNYLLEQHGLQSALIPGNPFVKNDIIHYEPHQRRK